MSFFDFFRRKKKADERKPSADVSAGDGEIYGVDIPFDGSDEDDLPYEDGSAEIYGEDIPFDGSDEDDLPYDEYGTDDLPNLVSFEDDSISQSISKIDEHERMHP